MQFNYSLIQTKIFASGFPYIQSSNMPEETSWHHNISWIRPNCLFISDDIGFIDFNYHTVSPVLCRLDEKETPTGLPGNKQSSHSHLDPHSILTVLVVVDNFVCLMIFPRRMVAELYMLPIASFRLYNG